MRVRNLGLISATLGILTVMPAALAHTNNNVITEVPFVCDKTSSGSVDARFVNSNGKSVLSIRSTTGSTMAQSAGMVLDGAAITPLPGADQATLIFKVQGDQSFFDNAGLVYTLTDTGFRPFVSFASMTAVGVNHGVTELNFTNGSGRPTGAFVVVGFGGTPYSGVVSDVVVNPFTTPSKIVKQMKVVNSCPPELP